MAMVKKNILLVVLDGMRADRMGCYGHSRNTSPALDRFAKRSTLWRDVSKDDVSRGQVGPRNPDQDPDAYTIIADKPNAI